jgi:hypothetical protein
LVWTCDCTGRSTRPATCRPPPRDGPAVRSVVSESRRQERARTLAETIIDLSDAMDTASIDLRHEQSDWAATA